MFSSFFACSFFAGNGGGERGQWAALVLGVARGEGRGWARLWELAMIMDIRRGVEQRSSARRMVHWWLCSRLNTKTKRER